MPEVARGSTFVKAAARSSPPKSQNGVAEMKFENGILAETLSVIFRVRYTAAIVFSLSIILVSLSTYFASRNGTNFATLFLYSIFAISIHATIIDGKFDEHDLSKPKVITGYALRLLAMVLVSFIAAAVIVLAVFNVSRHLAVGLITVIGLIIYPLILSLYGTCLPAKAVGGDASWSTAFHRGRLTFRYAAARLLLVNGALLISLVAAGMGLFAYLLSVGVIEKGAPGAWLTAVAAVSGILTSMLMTAMASTVLSRAYLIAENPSRTEHLVPTAMRVTSNGGVIAENHYLT
jgi:hypothetical protein